MAITFIFALIFQVSLSFSEDDSILPRSDVSLSVTAQPSSYIGLLAVDQSVLLLGDDNDLSQEEVRDLLFLFANFNCIKTVALIHISERCNRV